MGANASAAMLAAAMTGFLTPSMIDPPLAFEQSALAEQYAPWNRNATVPLRCVLF
jgi:hypothetical protein